MPQEYTAMWKAMVKDGVPVRIAKARAATEYFKKHGITVKEAHDRGLAITDGDIADLDCSYVLKILGQDSFHGTATDVAPPEDEFEAMDTFAGGYEIDKGDFTVGDDGMVLVVGTKVGAPVIVTHDDKKHRVHWTEDVLKAMTHTWEGGTVGRNHKTDNEGEIIMSEYKDGKSYHLIKPAESLVGDLSECVGVSIEGRVKADFEKETTLQAKGTGITFVFPPQRPACTIEQGCVALGGESPGENMGDNDEKTQGKDLDEAKASLAVVTDKLSLVNEKLEKAEATLAERDKEVKDLKESQKSLEEFKATAEKTEKEELVKELGELGVATDVLGDEPDMETLRTALKVAKATAKKTEDNAEEDGGAEETTGDPGKATDEERKQANEALKYAEEHRY